MMPDDDQYEFDFMKTPADGSALRYDADKPPVSLVPPDFILALAEHYGRGARKYEARNWEKGMFWSRCYDSAMRHLLAFWAGEDVDPETGTPHVIAVAWNMAALHHYMTAYRQGDDRPLPHRAPEDGPIIEAPPGAQDPVRSMQEAPREPLTVLRRV